MFINRARQKHGDRYDYSHTKFVNMTTKVAIHCNIHGEFLQTPDNHLRCNGCPACAYQFNRYASTRHTLEQFIQKATDKHGAKYDYSQTSYVNDSSKVCIICPDHGKFHVKATTHLLGGGCQKCANRYHRSTEEFIDQASAIHNGYYVYANTRYINNKTNVDITCPMHGDFVQVPQVHLGGGQCPKCRVRSYSKAAIEWLQFIALRDGIFIQHAENLGEYVLPSLNIRVDGYCASNNTVYEYYGDIWHGNPDLFAESERCGPSSKTAGELLTKTINRETLITQAGYNLICIWENDWKVYLNNNNNKETTNDTASKSSSVY